MPYKHVIKVSDKVYEKIQELMKTTGIESPNQVLEKLLGDDHGVTPSTVHRATTPTDHRVTPSIRIKKEEDPFWLSIVVGEGYNTEYIALNRIQYEKLCRTGLLPSTICENK
jgi:predicted CopG family antitoxin